ncbi:MAG: hypothetical protein HZY79_03985 [Rhodoblastus sp.]|nr:MAG: hypothetical protein HZY79_03985 [Rhodoblastus sp.]
MEQQIAISLQTVARLKAHAEPLVDTFDTVINRAVDALENANGKGATGTDGSIPLANPAAPPNLSFTTVRSIVMNGKRFAANEAYWNHLLFAVIREAKKSLSQEKVTELIVCNHVIGKKRRTDTSISKMLESPFRVRMRTAHGRRSIISCRR